MRRGAAVGFLAALSACSLLNSLDGFTGGAAPDGGPVVGNDGATEAAPIVDASDAADVTATDRSQLYALAVLADKPRGYWRLEETSGVAAKDETGNYGGTYLAGPMLGKPGVVGSRAVKLRKNTNARLRIDTADFRFSGNKPFTVELWAKVGVLEDYQWLGGTELVGSGVRTGWSFFVKGDGNVRYEVWRTDDGGPPIQPRGLTLTTTPLALGGAFRHIVLAYTGSALIGYIDGVDKIVNSPSAAPDVDTGVFVWGCRGDLANCLDDWTIDELAIYDFELSAARVTAHYDLGK